MSTCERMLAGAKSVVFVKQMIERQGERIWVESAPGAGSTCLFSLPGAHPCGQDAGDQATPSRGSVHQP